MADGTFQCEHCGKSFRWKPEFAGKSARCKCGEKVRIPATDPALEEDDLFPLGDELDALAAAGPVAAAPAARSARNPVCRKCGAKLKPEAVICVECGTNQKTGKAITAEVETLSKKDRKAAAWESGMNGLKLVRLGLWCNLIGLMFYFVLFITVPVIAFRQIEIADSTASLINIGQVVAQICLAVSPLLCMFVPKESGARLMLWISQTLLAGNLLIEFIGESMVLPLWVYAAGPLISIVGTLFLLLFLLKLAIYLDYGDLIEAARSLVKSFIWLIISGFLILFGVVGCWPILVFLGTAIYSAFVYVLLLYSLTRSISASLKEDFG